MENTSNKMETTSASVGFRVIGYGESTSDMIREIREVGYNDLQADVIHVGDTITPTDENKMIIVLCDNVHDDMEKLLDTFHQAGVLTIVISTDMLNISDKTYDSSTVVDRNEIVNVANTLLSLIFFIKFVCFNFDDLDHMLRNSKKFVMLTAHACGENRISDAITQLFENEIFGKGIGNLNVVLRYNPYSSNPPRVIEFRAISKYINELPGSGDIRRIHMDTYPETRGMRCTTILYDTKLDNDTIGLTAIATGRNLKI